MFSPAAKQARHGNQRAGAPLQTRCELFALLARRQQIAEYSTGKSMTT
jgi:hypothetical protein